ncbi:MAG: putative Ig domain-containing protein [Actinomycetota bacterium]
MERLLGEADPGAVGNSDNVEPAPLEWSVAGTDTGAPRDPLADAPVDWGPATVGYGPGSPPPPETLSPLDALSARIEGIASRFRWGRILLGVGFGLLVLAAVSLAFRSQDQSQTLQGELTGAPAVVNTPVDTEDVGGIDTSAPAFTTGGTSADGAVLPPTTAANDTGATLERPTTEPTVTTTTVATTTSTTVPTTVETTASTVETTTSTETTVPTSESTTSSSSTTSSTEPVPTEPLAIIDPGQQNSEEGDEIVLALAATGGDGTPVVWSANRLPAGLRIDPETGVISGELRRQTATQVAVQAVDGTYEAAIGFVWLVF